MKLAEELQILPHSFERGVFTSLLLDEIKLNAAGAFGRGEDLFPWRGALAYQRRVSACIVR